MNHREEQFKRRFAAAAQQLSAMPEQVVSLKLRGFAGAYRDYQELVDVLKREAGLDCTEVKLDQYEKGYILGRGKTSVIVVEHETGLEILYIAGAVASLIGLVPMVLQGWRALHAHLPHRDIGLDHGIEVRRLDASGRLTEERIHNPPFGAYATFDSLLPALYATANIIQADLGVLSHEIQALRERVEALEKKGQCTEPDSQKQGDSRAGKKRKAKRRQAASKEHDE
ncbi:MAG TPA: hypothetical protein VMH22_01015 [bacterium]|nr:hypothetical protein [bacterium]